MCPYHDYPDHYYNMTRSGLRNLFEEFLEIDNQDILASGLPIFSLTWILNSWANGLDEETRKSFLEMSVQELLADPVSYLEKPFVKNLSKEKNFELLLQQHFGLQNLTTIVMKIICHFSCRKGQKYISCFMGRV